MLEAVVKLRRELPETSIEEAKKALASCELNVKQAAAILKARHKPVIEHDGVVRSPLNGSKVPARRLGSIMKRKPPDLSYAYIYLLWKSCSN